MRCLSVLKENLFQVKKLNLNKLNSLFFFIVFLGIEKFKPQSRISDGGILDSFWLRSTKQNKKSKEKKRALTVLFLHFKTIWKKEKNTQTWLELQLRRIVIGRA